MFVCAGVLAKSILQIIESYKQHMQIDTRAEWTMLEIQRTRVILYKLVRKLWKFNELEMTSILIVLS